MGKQRNERTTKNMGLAASQARFLCITARKADCEYKSTDLAQQKLNITNQMSAISNDYANAMNATKLMWSNDTVDGDYGLSYSLLMTPSAVNDFNPYMVTTSSGAVVLNNEYAAAARAAGISKGGGLGSQEQRDKFIQALVPGGLVTQETADAITKYDYRVALDEDGELAVEDTTTETSSVDWNPFAGVGAEPKNKSVVDAMKLSDLATSKNFGQETFNWSILTDNNDDLVNSNNFNFGSDKIDAVGKYSIVVNGVINHNQGQINSLNLGDLLTSNVIIVSNRGTLKSGKTEAEFLTASKGKTGKEYDNIYKQYYDIGKEDLTDFQKQVSKLIDFIYEKFSVFNTDDASEIALEYAKSMTKKQFSREFSMGSNTSTALTDNSAFKNASSYNGIGSDEDGNYLALSLSNIMSAFLTYYDNSLNGSNSEYVVGNSVEQSIFVTDNSNYYYLFQNDDTAVTKITDKAADFYDQLYNNILAHGWREDSAIDDSEYLESMIKDGRYSMSSLNQDGYYYQTRYNDTGYLVEVSDTDAIARAEAEFSAKKAELTYKEDAIDLKTKKLDVEISALTQEYQSVQTMITNGIQKAFQMFQS